MNTIQPVRPVNPVRPIRLSEAEAAILRGLPGLPPIVVDDTAAVDPWDVEADPAAWPEDVDVWTWTIADDDSDSDLDPEPFVPTEADARWWAETSELLARRRSGCPIDGAREPELLPSGCWA